MSIGPSLDWQVAALPSHASTKCGKSLGSVIGYWAGYASEEWSDLLQAAAPVYRPEMLGKIGVVAVVAGVILATWAIIDLGDCVDECHGDATALIEAAVDPNRGPAHDRNARFRGRGRGGVLTGVRGVGGTSGHQGAPCGRPRRGPPTSRGTRRVRAQSN